MQRLMKLLLIVVVSGFCMEKTWAASGKCTVVKVDGTRMVIECNKQSKGFSKGNQIKIKSDRKKGAQNK